MATASGALLWTVALTRVRPQDVGDLGLVTALPIAAFVALGLVTIGLGTALARPQASAHVYAVNVLMLIFVLYGAPALIADVPSFNVTWRHIGVSDYIVAHGSVDTTISAYFNWPGFFVLTALASELAGLDSALELTRWAPLVYNLMYLGPLILIARSASDDPRLPWLTASIFYLANWVYQDYFSPQGLAYLLYLSLLAILLTWLGGHAPRRWRPLPPSRHERPKAPPVQQAALMVVCFLIVLVAAPTHQLTPFAILVAVAALDLAGRCQFRALPAIALVLTVTWVLFAAGEYMNGHLDTLKEDVGQLGATVSANVGSRVSGSDDHLVVTRLRLVFSVLLWALAALAAVILLRRRATRYVPHIILAAVPLGLVLMQAYGGEILFRVYLFSLPFVAVLVSSLALVRADAASPLRVATYSLAAAVLLGSFMITRYGNERVALFTPGEVRVVHRLTKTVPIGSLMLAPNPQLPWQAARIGELRFRTLDSVLAPAAGERPKDLARAIEVVATNHRDDGVFVLITRNTREYERLFGASRWGTIAELERSLAAAPQFDLIEKGPDADVYALRAEFRGQGQ